MQNKYSPYEIFHVRTSNNLEAIQYLHGLEGIEMIENKDDYILISIKDSYSTDNVKRRAVETLFMNKLDIYEIFKVTTSVEDIFFKLVSENEEGRA